MSKGNIKPMKPFEMNVDGRTVRVRAKFIEGGRNHTGKCYVNARWESPGWVFRRGTDLTALQTYSLRDGVVRVVRP